MDPRSCDNSPVSSPSRSRSSRESTPSSCVSRSSRESTPSSEDRNFIVDDGYDQYNDPFCTK